MPFTFLGSTTGTDNGASSATSGVLDTTGADLFVIIGARSSGGGFGISDTKVNGWNGLTYREVAGGERVQIFYANNVAGKAGSGHQFTLTGPFVSFVAMAYGNGGVAPSFDSGKETGNDTYGTTLQPGSVGPSVNDCLVIQGLAFNTQQAGLVTINSGYTIRQQLDRISGGRMGVAGADLIQTVLGATNPQWAAAITSMAAVSAVFKPTGGSGGGGGGGGSIPRMGLLGVG